MKTTTKQRVAIETPWGVAQESTPVCPGIVFVSTPSHGGYRVEGWKLAEMPEELRSIRTFCGEGGWYEEDCDWAIVAVAFPEVFPAEVMGEAKAMLQYIVTRRQGGVL